MIEINNKIYRSKEEQIGHIINSDYDFNKKVKLLLQIPNMKIIELYYLIKIIKGE